MKPSPTVILISLIAAAGAHADSRVDFVRDVRPILENRCYGCHGPLKQKSGLRLDIREAALKGGEYHSPNLVPGHADASNLIRFIRGDDSEMRMPKNGEPLPSDEIATISAWVEQGAVWPDGVDTATLDDPADHWAFKPLRPFAEGASIDAFVSRKLEEGGLTMAPEAERVTWLRRVFLDLTGLPPTPEQLAAFVSATPEAAVESLLASPRYGERWAQHWLDVVRYADTHGFEVNTPRPNAWPYRDYVIDAFNRDTPYDRFIREQLAGDLMDKDAATGFLVTAAALLPGQIGQDPPSMRLARQDELGEIVTNTSEAFLGLTVACARCHDHKFDPVSAKDYYAMQAFFAGVSYGDRPLRTPESMARREEADALRRKIHEIDRTVAGFVPLARSGIKRPPVNSRLNIERFTPVTTRRVRFSIRNTNLYAACIDELEVFDAAGRNVALASAGTTWSTSGSNVTANRHQPEFINDGEYGNARSWMCSEIAGWIALEFPEEQTIERIAWGRDREGEYTDRLAIDYAIEVEHGNGNWQVIADSGDRHIERPPVNARLNVEKFEPTPARKVRLTIRDSNQYEPCIDELEVFDASGRNIALASAGTAWSASGSKIDPGRHQPEFINDGHYGNESSWMCDATRGWIQLEFPVEQTIERIEWARDREGKFADRLAIDYLVEVADDSGPWRVVADTANRLRDWPRDTDVFTGMSEEERARAKALLAEKGEIEATIESLQAQQVVFGGLFGAPQPVHLLSRGDPEQPKEPIQPAVLEALGDVMLPMDAPDTERRMTLANWIARPDHPLTARVMVNRIWQGHFGIGLVETSNDFGRAGAEPSHPELLDWLASEFIRSGWSVKHMHRLIVLSGTYRQSARINPGAQAKDADARLLWRFPSRRLEAESIRDSILAVSGRLNLETGGPGFDLFTSRGGLSGFPPVESFGGDGLRRMIYAHKIRMEPDAVFGAFDCPDAGQSVSRRRQSTTPIQALNLLNSRFVIDEAQALAGRVRVEAGDGISPQIARAYWLAFGRAPAADEIAHAEPVVLEHGLETLCRVLLNTSEFLFIP